MSIRAIGEEMKETASPLPPPGETQKSIDLATTDVLGQLFVNGDIGGVVGTATALDSAIAGEHASQSQQETSGHITTINGKIQGLFIAFLDFVRGKLFAEQGHVNKDSAGFTAGILRMFRGASEFYSSGSGLSSRGISIAGKADSLKNVIAGLAIASTVGSSTAAGIVAISAGLSLKESYKMGRTFEEERKKIAEADTPQDEAKAIDDTFNCLEALVKIDETDIKEVIEDANGVKLSKCSDLFQKLFGNEKTRLALEIKQYLVNGPESEEKEKEFKTRAKELGIVIQGFDGLENDVKRIYACIEIERIKERKKAKFSRVFGSDVYEQIQKVDVDKASLIDKAHKNREKNKLLNFAIGCVALFGFGLGIALQVLSATPVGAAVEIVELCLSLLLGLAWTVIDGYFALQAFMNNDHTKTEKVLMVLSTLATSLTTLASIVVLKVGSSLSKLVLPTLAVGLWLTTTLYLICSRKTKQVAC